MKSAPFRVALAALLLAGCHSGDDAPPSGAPDGSTVADAPADSVATDTAVDAPSYTDHAQIEARLTATLEGLAAFGPKRAGSPADQKAGDYMHDRFVAAGFKDVRFESFTFPAHSVASSSLSLTIAGGAHPAAHEVFAYSGAGSVDADVVYVGTGHETDYAGKDVTGKVVLVDADSLFHRTSQYALIRSHGGAAMLYASLSPENLIQVGTVADAEDGLGPMPAIAIGHDDGAALESAIAAGKTVHAAMSVTASVAPATGRNVVATLPGTVPGALLVGAHYDTWFTGSVDNSSGSAALVELASALAARTAPRHTLYFVAYDAEEVGLFGGYDFLRHHIVTGARDVMAFVNLEMPSAKGTGTRALAHSEEKELDDSLTKAGLPMLYATYSGMELVPAVFGGIIPTDIQGMYRSGVHGSTTFCDTPYYHTKADTPDKVDVPFLASSVLAFEDALGRLDLLDAATFATRDETLWNADVKTASAASGTTVTVVVRDAAGAVQAGANVEVRVDVDDFTRSFRGTATTDASGTATVTIPASALSAGSGSRWLHVTAGTDYPFVESIAKLP